MNTAGSATEKIGKTDRKILLYRLIFKKSLETPYHVREIVHSIWTGVNERLTVVCNYMIEIVEYIVACSLESDPTFFRTGDVGT
jgi:hypothetical protein